MMWMSLVVAAVTAAEPCEAPRVRDTAPLVNAMAQDKVLGLTFTKAAGICEERGQACDQARLECATMLASTIQKQVGFDEGMWLRDMLLPFNGANYPMTRTFGAVAIAQDASCNVDVPTLTAAGQRRMVQASRRDTIFQEYNLYARWTQTQLQKCKEQAASNEARAAQAKAESERLAAASAALTAVEAARLKQAQEAAKAKADAEKRAQDAADAEVRRQKDQKEMAERELKRKEEADRLAREEREKDKRAAEARQLKAEEDRKKEKTEAEETRKKEKAEAEETRRKERAEAEAQRLKDKEETEAKLQKAKEEAAAAQKAAEDKRIVTERDNRVAQARLTKARLVSEAEENFKRAKDDELLKKQAAVDAVSSSPAIAQAAVAEAAQAEKTRVDAEKRLVEARQKAAAIVIDDSFERGAGSVFVAGGASGLDTGFALGVMGGAHFGFWGTAPPEGMASGFELRLWGRYLGGLAPATSSFDSLLTARYFFGAIGVGLAGELRLTEPNLGTLRGGVGPALVAAFVDNHEARVAFGVNYLPLGNTLDGLRFVGDFEVSYKFITIHLHGGSASRAGGPLSWQIGGYLGVRATW